MNIHSRIQQSLNYRSMQVIEFFLRVSVVITLLIITKQNASCQFILNATDWQNQVVADYNKCTGKLRVSFAVAEQRSGAGGTGNTTNRLNILDIYAKPGTTGSPIWLTSVYRTFSNTTNVNKTPPGHVVGGTISFGTTFNQQKYGYSASKIGTTASHVSSFSGVLNGLNHTIVTLEFDDLPDSWFGTTTNVEMRNVDWTEGVDGVGQVFFLPTYSKMADEPQPQNGGLSNLAFERECGQIKLTWSGISSSAFTCTASSLTGQLFRKKTTHTTYAPVSSSFPISSNSYTDMGLLTGEQYDYRIEVKERLGIRTSTSETFLTNAEVIQPLSPAPSNITASTTGCFANDDKISVTWTFTTDPMSFEIDRALNAGFTVGTQLFTVAPNLRDFIDNSASPNTNYYYRVRAINDCNDTSLPSASKMGFLEGTPSEPNNVSATPTGSSQILVSWSNQSSSQTGIILERTFTGGGSALIIALGPTVTSYTDNDVNQCVTYTYKVKAKSDCFPLGVGTQQQNAILAPDLSNTFATDGTGFLGSKGTFTDKVELNWTNNNEGATNTIKIYRRVLESGNNFSLLTTLNSSSGIFNDLFTEAGELYEYEILAEGPCAGAPIVSNSVRTIGFRRKTGIVTGKVSFAGGTNVENVKITAGDATNNTFPSIDMTATQIASISDNATLDVADELIVETWFKPDTYGQHFDLIDKNGSYAISFNATMNQYSFTVSTNNGPQTVTIGGSLYALDTWNHIAGMLYQDSLSLLVNGVVEARIPVPAGSDIIDNSTNLNIGSGFTGHIKEFRQWNIGKDDLRMSQDYSRFLAGNEEGLVIYLNAGERKGTYAYDFSHIGSTFNNNHALLSTSGMWHNTDSPDPERLSIASFTNMDGEYTLILPFAGAGQNFVLRPVFGQHEFDPSSRPVFIGDGATVQNNIDFEDISSFSTSGFVTFHGTNCPSAGVLVKVDGEPVIRDGNAVFTDANGFFDIQVPIGRHVITLERNGHFFNEGRFPPDPNEEWDFQETVPAISFSDSTFRKVVGRIVGGDIEGNKPPGLGRSKNNIGIAELTFDPLEACGWVDSEGAIPRLDTMITTIDSSGEYAISLPPLNYIVSRPEIVNNNGLEVIDDLNVPLDLRNIPFSMVVIDTIIRPDFSLQIDSVRYHEQFDFIYKAPIEVNVTEENGDELSGDDSYIFSHSKLGDFPIAFDTTSFPYPVFSQNKRYPFLLSTFEEYVNKDGPMEISDRVPVINGTVIINNDLAAQTSITLNLSNFDNYGGDTILTFVAGQPNTTGDFTKRFQVSLASGTQSDTWEPNGQVFKGFIVGVKDVEESDFATQGPELVDYILRDPPGSQSFAERSVGISSTTESSWEWNVGGAVDIDASVFGGTAFNLGIGYSTSTEIEATVNIGFHAEASGGEGQTIVETITNEESWSTSSGPLLAGADSDLFIGTSRNYLFGISTKIAIVPDIACANSLIECIGPAFSGYQIAKQKSLAIAGSDFETEFIYTASHIEIYEIPQLEELRNNILATNPNYTSQLGTEEPCYGSNNDDVRWDVECFSSIPTSPDPMMTTPADTIGPSYIFKDPLSSMPDSVSIDSIRLFNQQIRLWKEALAFNEEQKALATEDPTNYSYAGGGASFSRSSTNSSNFTQSRTFEFNFQESISFKVGGKVGGAGFDDSYSASLTQNRTEVDNITTDTTETVGFTITDDSEWDDFTFDVYEGSGSGGPIFKILGGRSSCPHEGQVVSKYYMPGTVLSPGSIQLEQPRLTIEPPFLDNIPQSESGIFIAEIANENQVGEGWEYTLSLLNHTNPGAALIINSGTSELSSTFNLRAGQAIEQSIIVEAGAAYEHDSLLFVLHSTCQYYQGLSAERDIADSAYFSIHFIPECTTVELETPTDQWVVNNTYDDTLQVRIGGYDYNHLNLDNIFLEYKPSSEGETGWITQQRFYHPSDTTRMNEHPEYNYIPNNTTYSSFDWDLSSLSDGEYDFRVVSDCSVAEYESPIYRGYIDTENPHAFGTPSPQDGILDPGDDIIIRFNEIIDPAYVSSNFNIDVRGKLNGTTIRQQESLALDGINDFGEIPEYQLQNRDITLEFWARRNRTGKEVILSQGLSEQDQLVVGFNSSDQLYFQLEDKTVSSTTAVAHNDWVFYAVVYYDSTHTVKFFVDNTPAGEFMNFVANYGANGSIIVAKNSATNGDFFQGNLQELRIWNITRDQGSIGESSSKTLSGREPGLVGNWPLDDSWGPTANEKVRSRHMNIGDASWNVEPASHTYEFNGTSEYLISKDAGTLATSPAQDLTFEGWFKTPDNGQKQTILSNGVPSILNPSLWAISIGTFGTLMIENSGNQLMTSVILADDSWHHFAMVLQRGFSTSLYIDGNLVETANASLFNDFGAAELVLGAQVDGVGVAATFSQYFDGLIDDIRIWNVARKPEQIGRDFINQLTGDEPGLLAYYPFDFYEEVLNIPSLTATLDDQAINTPGFDLTAMGGAFSTVRPTIKLPRKIKEVVTTYSINGDELFIDLNVDPAEIENVTLDITVRAIRDFAGNYMESPETWIAYIDKNQVFWETEYFNFEKNIDDPLSFTANIKNIGGSQESFSLSNLPSWLTASPTFGLIDSNSTLEVTFTVLPGINIGEYEQDIFVTTQSFGFNERLLLDLKVVEDPPEWIVDENEFSFDMNIVGQLRINEILSTDDEDIVSVWVNGELRGTSNVQFDDASGKYLVFFTVQSNDNTPSSELLEFRAWDASRGRILVDLLPDATYFANNDILGTLSAPIPIEATVFAERTYALNPGWNWLSFPLSSPTLDDVNQTLSDLTPATGDQIKSQDNFNTFDGTSWTGNIPGFNTSEGYKIKSTNADEFTYSGSFLNPSNEPITIEQGWNWVGVKSEFNIDIESVLNSLQDLQTGDLIKSQGGFAQYDSEFGWGGSLDFFEPQKGYMLFYNQNGVLNYPGNGQSFRHQEEEHRQSLAKVKTKPNRHKSLSFQIGKYSSTMSLVADIEECLAIDPDGNALNLSDWLLAAYVDNEIRGLNEVNYISELNQYTYYLSIEGDETATLDFKLLHSTNGSVINLEQELTYNINEITGSTRDPFSFTCGALSECKDELIFRTADIDPTQSQISISAQLNLRSDAVLPSGIMFRFSAGREIELMSGFESTNGAVLEAFIESCNNSN